MKPIFALSALLALAGCACAPHDGEIRIVREDESGIHYHYSYLGRFASFEDCREAGYMALDRIPKEPGRVHASNTCSPRPQPYPYR